MASRPIQAQERGRPKVSRSWSAEGSDCIVALGMAWAVTVRPGNPLKQTPAQPGDSAHRPHRRAGRRWARALVGAVPGMPGAGASGHPGPSVRWC